MLYNHIRPIIGTLHAFIETYNISPAHCPTSHSSSVLAAMWRVQVGHGPLNLKTDLHHFQPAKVPSQISNIKPANPSTQHHNHHHAANHPIAAAGGLTHHQHAHPHPSSPCHDIQSSQRRLRPRHRATTGAADPSRSQHERTNRAPAETVRAAEASQSHKKRKGWQDHGPAEEVLERSQRARSRR